MNDHKPWVTEEDTEDDDNDDEDEDDGGENVEEGFVVALVQQLLVHQTIPVGALVVNLSV